MEEEILWTKMGEENGEIFRATCMTDFNWKYCSFARNSGFMFAKSFYTFKIYGSDYSSLSERLLLWLNVKYKISRIWRKWE